MSQRTIVEFNHDYAELFDKDPEIFLNGIRTLLNEGSTVGVVDCLNRFGIKVTPTMHHSDRRNLFTPIGEFTF